MIQIQCNFRQMSDAQLERARESYDAYLYRQYYGDDIEYHCKDCTHYCPARKGEHAQCERLNDDDEEYYVDVNPDDDVCKDFEAEEVEEDDNFDYFEYLESKNRQDDDDWMLG